jgi:hypothetical protein
MKEGQTYSELSEKYDVSVEQLREWNKFPDRKIPVDAKIAVSKEGFQQLKEEGVIAKRKEAKQNSAKKETTDSELIGPPVPEDKKESTGDSSDDKKPQQESYTDEVFGTASLGLGLTGDVLKARGLMNLGKAFGYSGAIISTAYDSYKLGSNYFYENNKYSINTTKYTINTGMTIYGLGMSFPANLLAPIYFGFEAYYPGGFMGALEDKARREDKVRKIHDYHGWNSHNSWAIPE